MRLAIVEYGCNFKETYQVLASGQASTYHSHSYIFELMQTLSQQLEVIYVCCCASPCEDTLLQPGLRSLNAGLDPYRQVDELIALLEAQDLTHVVIHFPHRQLFQWATRKKIRTLGILADSFDAPGWRTRLRNFQLARVLNHPQVDWIGNHGASACRSLKRIGVDPGKIVPFDWAHPTTPQGIPVKQLRPDGSWQLLYVGSVTESKGVGDAIAAVAELRRRQVPVQLDIVGHGELEQFQRQSEALQVTDLVTFVGKIPNDQVMLRMRQADIVLVPSHPAYPEGCPFTIFEALCARTPMVVSDHPVFRDNLVHRSNAMVFPAQNAIAFADCIQQLVGDPVLYRQLSEMADDTWERLQVPVSWGNLIERWVMGDAPWLSSHSLASGIYDRAKPVVPVAAPASA
jgi:glycosyltransferase involved in cell wall biosynthesis